MRFWWFCLLLLFGCSEERGTMRIGIDKTWAPLDFGAQQAYVNGYTEELLKELAHYSGMRFEVSYVNWDTLFDGMEKGLYDAVLTSKRPFEHLKKKYEFSSPFLDLGPVVVVREKTKDTDLSGKLVGTISDANAIEKNSEILIREYNSVPELLNAVVNEEIYAAVLGRIPAVNYVADIYHGQLKIASNPLTNEGLRLCAKKGEMGGFNRHLESYLRQNQSKALLQKWQL